MAANRRRWLVHGLLFGLGVAPWMVVDLLTGHTLIGWTTPSAMAAVGALLWWWERLGLDWWLAEHEAQPLQAGDLDPLRATVVQWAGQSMARQGHQHTGSPLAIWVVEDPDPNLATPAPGHLVLTSGWLDTWPNRPDSEDRLVLDRMVWAATSPATRAWLRMWWVLALPAVLVERLEAMALRWSPVRAPRSAAARVDWIRRQQAARAGRAPKKPSRLVLGLLMYYPALVLLDRLLRPWGQPQPDVMAAWADTRTQKTPASHRREAPEPRDEGGERLVEAPPEPRDEIGPRDAGIPGEEAPQGPEDEVAHEVPGAERRGGSAAPPSVVQRGPLDELDWAVARLTRDRGATDEMGLMPAVWLVCPRGAG